MSVSVLSCVPCINVVNIVYFGIFFLVRVCNLGKMGEVIDSKNKAKEYV